MPDEDKTFIGSFVLDFRRQAHTLCISARAEVRHVIATKFQPGLKFAM